MGKGVIILILCFLLPTYCCLANRDIFWRYDFKQGYVSSNAGPFTKIKACALVLEKALNSFDKTCNTTKLVIRVEDKTPEEGIKVRICPVNLIQDKAFNEDTVVYLEIPAINFDISQTVKLSLATLKNYSFLAQEQTLENVLDYSINGNDSFEVPKVPLELLNELYNEISDEEVTQYFNSVEWPTGDRTKITEEYYLKVPITLIFENGMYKFYDSRELAESDTLVPILSTKELYQIRSSDPYYIVFTKPFECYYIFRQSHPFKAKGPMFIEHDGNYRYLKGLSFFPLNEYDHIMNYRNADWEECNVLIDFLKNQSFHNFGTRVQELKNTLEDKRKKSSQQSWHKILLAIGLTSLIFGTLVMLIRKQLW